MAKKSGRTLTYILLSALIVLCAGGILSQTNSIINDHTSPEKPSGDVVESIPSEDTSSNIDSSVSDDLNEDTSSDLPSDDITDVPSEEPVLAKSGWHIVNDLFPTFT